MVDCFWGLGQDCFTMNMGMLERYHRRHRLPEPYPTLRSRVSTEFLPNLITSRISTPNHRLPVLNSPYWITARAHLFAGSVPPYLTKQICSPIIEAPVAWQQHFLRLIKHQWQASSNSVDWYIPNYSQVQCQIIKNIGFLVIPIASRDIGYFQDGTKKSEANVYRIAFHGTRISLAPSILRSGLFSSHKSHSATGAWINIGSVVNAIDWNVSVLDITAGLAFQIAANSTDVR